MSGHITESKRIDFEELHGWLVKVEGDKDDYSKSKISEIFFTDCFTDENDGNPFPTGYKFEFSCSMTIQLD